MNTPRIFLFAFGIVILFFSWFMGVMALNDSFNDFDMPKPWIYLFDFIPPILMGTLLIVLSFFW